MVNTDASLTGWGQSGKAGWCVETSLGWQTHRCLRIEGGSPCSEGSPQTTDNSCTVYHINHQGGTGSLHCLQLAQRLLFYAFHCLASLRAIYIPGVVNRAADLLSRTGPPPGEWRLHPEVVALLWTWFSVTVGDWPICIGRDNPLQDVVLPEGSGRFPGTIPWCNPSGHSIAVCFFSINSDSPGTHQGRPGPLQGTVNSPPDGQGGIGFQSSFAWFTVNLGPCQSGWTFRGSDMALKTSRPAALGLAPSQSLSLSRVRCGCPEDHRQCQGSLNSC